jgi:serralysin
VLVGGGGDDWMSGRRGDDIYHVDSANDLVFEYASEGHDTVIASATYVLQSGAAIERLSAVTGTAPINLTGNEFSQDIVGNAGSNHLIGGGGDDWFFGGAGNDFYYIDSANDLVFEYAGQGHDTIYVSASFRLDPSAEIEVISADSLGGTSAISLIGTDIAQELWGNMGSNYLDGKRGNDALYGIGGDDIFAFTTALGSNNIDRVYGFGTSGDRVHLGGDIFTAISAGTLSASAFTIGSAATSSTHRIIYNSSNGALLYDADGSGSGAAVQFATLDAGMALTHNSFEVTARTSNMGAKSSASSEEGIPDWQPDHQGTQAAFDAVGQGAFEAPGGEAHRLFVSAPLGAQELYLLAMI